MTLSDPTIPEAPPRRATRLTACPRPRRPFPWRVFSALVALLVGAGLCLADKNDAGMLVLGSALLALGAPTLARTVKGK